MRHPPGRAALPWLTGLSLLVSLGGLLLAAGLSLAARDGAHRHAAQETTARAKGLEQRINADVALFELALRDAARVPAEARIKPLEHPLIARHLGFLNLLDATGDVTADSRAGPPKPANYAGRDYFQAHLRDPADTIAVGRPFATAPNQQAMLPLSRRLNDAEGRFAGVVVAGVRLAWLREMLEQSPGPQNASVTIRREDGIVLMGTPFDPDAIGRGGATDTAWLDWRRTGTAFVQTEAGVMHLFHRLGAPGSMLVLEFALDRAALAAEAPFRLPWLLALSLPPVPCVLALAWLAHAFRRRGLRVEAAALHAKDDHRRLLATMSHELRTPLAGILGQAELLREEGGLSPRQATRLTRLTEAGALMRHVVNRVIDLSRPDDHTHSLTLAPCDLDLLMRRCRGLVESAARAKGLHLTSHVSPSVPRHAMLSEEMQPVLVNLLANAVKFTVQGTIELRLTGDAARLRFEVADTGRGIPRGKRHRLFREYDRLDAAEGGTAPGTEGTGLGLSISETLVRRMGGRIGHLDNPGGGSVFWVELPLAPLPDTGAEPVPEPAVPCGPVGIAQPPEPAGRALRVLLADDLDVTRAVTADFLRAAGHAVTEAADGGTAARVAGERDFDVVLTDMRMPGCDGLEAARRIRAHEGHRGRVPIVLVTADLEARTLGPSEETGLDACVIKPFTREELLAAVEAVARPWPEPPAETPAPPLLDVTTLAQLRDSMGADAIEAHLRTAMHRIEELLPLLDDARTARQERTRDAVHDLVGVTGLIGLSALAAHLRRFDLGWNGDGDDALPTLRETAADTLRVLRNRQDLATVD